MKQQSTSLFLYRKVPRRSRFEITYELLKQCKAPIKKTRLLWTCNLNVVMGNEYLNALVVLGFLSKVNDAFLLTPLGVDFMEGLETLLMLWNQEMQ